MKNFIFVINCLLAVSAAGMIFYNVVSSGNQEQEYSVKKAGKKTVEKKKVSYAVQTPETEWKDKIVNQNIFSYMRNPGGMVGIGQNSIQLSLVGICDVGGVKSAVIVQKTGRQRNFPFGGNFGPRENTNNQQKSSPQQYVRVGETLSNGYTLTEITRTGAVLMRNGKRMDLELQKASVTATPANSSNRRNQRQNDFQQIQRMQMFQNMQMMRMMRMMQNNGNSNNFGDNRNSGSGIFGGGMMRQPGGRQFNR